MKLNDLLILESDLNKAKAYVRKVFSMAHPNPIGHGVVFSYKIKADPGEDIEDSTFMVKVDMLPMGDGTVVLKELIIIEGEFREGLGSFVLKKITDVADQMNITLSLNAVPLEVRGKKKVPKSKLISFYKKHKFVSQKAKDYMIRVPK